MQSDGYRIFVSHGSRDLWVAAQIAKALHEVGTEPFLDERDISKGADFKGRIHEEIGRSRELVALFTPWSAKRSWVWVEIGAAWMKEIRVVGVFYGMTASDLEKDGQGKAFLEDINTVELNHLGIYLEELAARVRSATA